MGFHLDIDIVRTQLERKGAPYRVEQILGTGSFGTVVKAIDERTGEHVAIKFIHASRMHDYLCYEVRNHRILRHPHVIRFKRVLEVGGHLAIVMEYADGSSLFQVIKKSRRLSEPLARWIFQQLILSVDYCHKKGVASRDIKCENVLLLKGHKLPIVKLSDFGYSHSATNQGKAAKSIVGTLDYMAPEVINNVDASSYDAFKADIWSCGVVLYVMLSGHYPFTRKHIPKGNTTELDVIRSKVAALDFKMPSQLSGGACNLISRILTHADQRISVNDIMEHPWFARHFPEEARTMNADLLAEEERGGATRTNDWQTDEEVEQEIMRANWFDKLRRPREIVTDDFIDEELDEELRKQGRS